MTQVLDSEERYAARPHWDLGLMKWPKILALRIDFLGWSWSYFQHLLILFSSAVKTDEITKRWGVEHVFDAIRKLWQSSFLAAAPLTLHSWQPWPLLHAGAMAYLATPVRLGARHLNVLGWKWKNIIGNSEGIWDPRKFWDLPTLLFCAYYVWASIFWCPASWLCGVTSTSQSGYHNTQRHTAFSTSLVIQEHISVLRAQSVVRCMMGSQWGPAID